MCNDPCSLFGRGRCCYCRCYSFICKCIQNKQNIHNSVFTSCYAIRFPFAWPFVNGIVILSTMNENRRPSWWAWWRWQKKGRNGCVYFSFDWICINNNSLKRLILWTEAIYTQYPVLSFSFIQHSNRFDLHMNQAISFSFDLFSSNWFVFYFFHLFNSFDRMDETPEGLKDILYHIIVYETQNIFDLNFKLVAFLDLL